MFLLGIEMLKAKIAYKADERNKAADVLSKLDRELRDLKAQAERSLYHGMDLHQYISYLHKNPIYVTVKGYDMIVQGYTVSCNLEYKGTKIYFEANGYKDNSAEPRMWLYLESGRTKCYSYYNCAEKHKMLMESLTAAAKSVSVLYSDIDNYLLELV